MNFQLSNFGAGLLLSVVEAVGDYAAKLQDAPLAYASYNSLAFILMHVLKRGSLTLVNSNWDGISNACTMAIGFAMGERFTETQYIGCILITIGLFLIN